MAGMARYVIPGAAVAVLYRGRLHVRGFGITNVSHPVPVDGQTLFRIGSTTKTFTGTAAVRLVEAGRLNLDAPVLRYLPDFEPPPGARGVTVRQLALLTFYRSPSAPTTYWSRSRTGLRPVRAPTSSAAPTGGSPGSGSAGG